MLGVPIPIYGLKAEAVALRNAFQPCPLRDTLGPKYFYSTPGRK